MENRLLVALTSPGSPRRIDATDLQMLRQLMVDEVRSNIEKFRIHPLGFAYYTKNIGQLRTLRFHIWTTELTISDAQSAGDIHDHVFELNSTVVAGELRQETFQFSEATDGEYEIANVEYVGNRSIVQRSGRQGNLLIASDDIFDAGQAYRLPAQTIHRARPHKLPMATIVLACLQPAPPPPMVIIQRGRDIPSDFDRRLLIDPEKKSLLSTVNQLTEL